MPTIMRIVLVLPAPFGPSRPNIVPGAIWNDRSSTATNEPYALRTLFSSTVCIVGWWLGLWEVSRILTSIRAIADESFTLGWVRESLRPARQASGGLFRRS